EESRVFPRIYRKPVLEVKDAEFTFVFIKGEDQPTTIEDRAILIAQNRNQHFALQFALEWIPVNIEELRVSGSFPVLQNVKPPGVITAHDPHVIGNDVKNLP